MGPQGVPRSSSKFVIALVEFGTQLGSLLLGRHRKMLITKDTWLGLTFFLIGLIGFLNYLSVIRIWSGISSRPNGCFNFIGISSLSCLCFGLWLLISNV